MNTPYRKFTELVDGWRLTAGRERDDPIALAFQGLDF
jgi:hypothetical protein